MGGHLRNFQETIGMSLSTLEVFLNISTLGVEVGERQVKQIRPSKPQLRCAAVPSGSFEIKFEINFPTQRRRSPLPY